MAKQGTEALLDAEWGDLQERQGSYTGKHKEKNRRMRMRMKELEEIKGAVPPQKNRGTAEGSEKGKMLKHCTHEKLKNAEALPCVNVRIMGKKVRQEDAGNKLKTALEEEEEEEGQIQDKGPKKQSKEQGSDGDIEFKVKVAARSTRSMFADGFEERRDLEQYFWSEKTVMQLKQALKATTWHTEHGHVCCLAAPSLAHAFFAEEGRIEALLDIDTRFSYLPGFRFFDLREPLASDECCADDDDFRIVVFDPPFFYIPLPVLFQAVLVAVHGNLQTKLLLGFLRREEGALLHTFAPFRLRRTRFVLEYATVKPNKWRNYALYANVDLPGIKRVIG